jgi:hypothetical protein
MGDASYGLRLDAVLHADHARLLSTASLGRSAGRFRVHVRRSRTGRGKETEHEIHEIQPENSQVNSCP